MKVLIDHVYFSTNQVQMHVHYSDHVYCRIPLQLLRCVRNTVDNTCIGPSVYEEINHTETINCNCLHHVIAKDCTILPNTRFFLLSPSSSSVQVDLHSQGSHFTQAVYSVTILNKAKQATSLRYHQVDLHSQGSHFTLCTASSTAIISSIYHLVTV